MNRDRLGRWLYFASLVLAAESIYMLPYLRKTFQTSMEEAFLLSAFDLGLLNSMFGIVALAAYFPGGWLADRFSARKLLTFSLISTGLGGLYMASLPSQTGLLVLHAFWGVTSILTFWAALIKAVRNWGGADQQGTGFGLFEAGRGLVAALLASIAAVAFALGNTPTEGLITVITYYASATFVAAALTWFLVPDRLYEDDADEAAKSQEQSAPGESERHAASWRHVLSRPRTWLMACVIFCAYFLFLGTYDFPAYAERAYDQTKLFGAQLGVFRDWMRPIAAVAAGLIADRFAPSRVIGFSFIALFVAYGSLTLLPAGPDLLWLLWGQVALAALAVFALRGIYYALMQEMRIPVSQTGMTVGFVSVVGYAPDLFAHSLAGAAVEAWGLETGYRMFFGSLTVCAAIGLTATWGIRRLTVIEQRDRVRAGRRNSD